MRFIALQGPSKPNLTEREMEEIIAEWTPEALVPALTEEEIADAGKMPVSHTLPSPLVPGFVSLVFVYST